MVKAVVARLPQALFVHRQQPHALDEGWHALHGLPWTLSLHATRYARTCRPRGRDLLDEARAGSVEHWVTK